MKYQFLTVAVLLSSLFLFTECKKKDEAVPFREGPTEKKRAVSDYTPIAVPPAIRVESSKGRQELYQRLTEKQKKLAYHLLQASRAGRTLLLYQSHRHALALRDIFVRSVTKKNLDVTKAMMGEGFNEYLIYVAKFLGQSGPYTSSMKKMVLSKVSPLTTDLLIRRYGKGVSFDAMEEMTRLLTDPKYEVVRVPIAENDRLEDSGTNLYEKGLTKEEVLAAKDAKKLQIDLNCRIEKGAVCHHQTLKSPGIVGETLKKFQGHLQAALEFSETDHQKKQITDFLRYLDSGDEKDFRASSIEWVLDGTNSAIDFVMGWVETYEDWMNLIGSWETILLVVDPEVTKISKTLATKADDFEALMPYEYDIGGEKKIFRKKFPADYAPPAIMGYFFHDVNTASIAGFNLPNFEDIRRKEGFKNVIRLPLPGMEKDPARLEMERSLVELYAPADKAKDIADNLATTHQIMVQLHEIIGHGSGDYDATKFGPNEMPTQVHGPLGGALEEERADLAGLVFGAHPFLLETGVVKDQATLDKQKTLRWDTYLAYDFSVGLASRRSLAEAHIRGRYLLVNQLLEAGAIEWISRDGGVMTPSNQVLKVKDYDLCQKVAEKLLGDLQRMKALREEKAVKELFAKYSSLDDAQQPWAKGIIERGEGHIALAGSVDQPWSVSEDLSKVELFGDPEKLESVAPYWEKFYGK